MKDDTPLPLICAFYTEGTPYEDIILKLEDSLIALGLRYKIKSYQSRGSWVANCAIKPEFLLDCLNDTDGDILYVDADAVIHKVPDINCIENIGVYYKLHKNGERELLSGTIYLKQEAIPLVEDWLAMQTSHPTMWDQKSLAAVVGNKTIHHLPQGYCKIFDAPWVEDDDLFIEHHQASRKHKASISDLPESINGIRIRKQIDGAFCLARKNKVLEARFDAKYVRVPNELKWLPFCKDGGLLSDEAQFFTGQTVYIIGKGPSLDSISKKDVTNGPIICINESIHVIERLNLFNRTYCIQQDMSLKASCEPKRAKLLVAYAARNHYPDLVNKIVFHMEEFQLKSCLTVIIAMRMAQRFGAARLILLGFDSINGVTSYAPSIGYPSTRGGDVKRFLAHKAMIEAEASVPISFGGK